MVEFTTLDIKEPFPLAPNCNHLWLDSLREGVGAEPGPGEQTFLFPSKLQ